ncbi:hypothetical protein BT96DRAFT_774835, partial [Gymnopus androsaceus JB14]
LKWSERHSTQAVHKLPQDWEDQCLKALFRIVYLIKEEDILLELFVNSDQTQVVYAQGSNLTWAETGAKQVTVVGADKKHAFTAVVSVSNSRELLLIQSIYVGKSKHSCPNESAEHFKDTTAANFRFEYSDTKTYWSTQETMRTLVDTIIAPYFDRKKEELGLSPNQKAIWQIDVWSVHCSKEFRSWLRENHPNIILIYVPGGC